MIKNKTELKKWDRIVDKEKNKLQVKIRIFLFLIAKENDRWLVTASYISVIKGDAADI